MNEHTTAHDITWALNLSRLLASGKTDDLTNGEARLRAKCRHEQMSRTAVLMEWGDPRTWEAPSSPSE